METTDALTRKIHAQSDAALSARIDDAREKCRNAIEGISEHGLASGTAKKFNEFLEIFCEELRDVLRTAERDDAVDRFLRAVANKRINDLIMMPR